MFGGRTERQRWLRGRLSRARRQYADVTTMFCTADRCPVIVGNNVVYRDDNHFTIEYAQVLGPVLGAIAERALAKR
jgi:hypothetical protein